MKSSLLVFLLMLSSTLAWGHKSSDSFITLKIKDQHVSARWDIALRDLDFALNIDADDNGAITWGELRANYERITSYAFARLNINNAQHVCTRQPGILQVDKHTDGTYAVINFTLDCVQPIEQLSIEYLLLFDLDPSHRGLMQVQQQSNTELLVFSPEHAFAKIAFEHLSYWNTFSQFFHEGIWHIWAGYDHILFLLCLLLPALVRKVPGGWVQTDDFYRTLWQVGKIVSAFTLAHSVTLFLAVLEIVSLPSRFVESAIALSVILVAINNLKPFFCERAWMIAFAFGLIHGFGFASVLSNLGLSSSNLGYALIAFNLGVESGQLAIVAVFLPIAYCFRAHWFYRRLVVSLGSQVIVLIATVWFLQRAFDISGLAVL